MNTAKASECPQAASEPDDGDRTIELVIYVAPHCTNCDYAYVVAEQVAREFSQVDVRFVNMAAPEEPVPESVFATPTYLLNGRVWSLGNPSEDDVRVALTPLVNT